MTDPAKYLRGSIPLPRNHDPNADGYVYALCITRLPDGENFYYVGEAKGSIKARVRNHDVKIVAQELPKPDSEGTSTEIMFKIADTFELTNIYEDEIEGELETHIRSLEKETYQKQKSIYSSDKILGGK